MKTIKDLLLTLNNHNIDIKTHVCLSSYTTMQSGGPCPCLVSCQSPDELISIIPLLFQNNIQPIVIGGGSNIVFSDEGVDQCIIRYFSKDPHIKKEAQKLFVHAATLLDHVAFFAAENGLNGLNFTSGIPGTVGGAIVGNAGAYGKQISDHLVEIQLLSLNGNLKTLKRNDLEFSYRHSKLKETSDIILSATFDLIPTKKDDLINERNNILQQREDKHPNWKTIPNSGSFFRNIEDTSASGKRKATGYLLEQAGAKSLTCGGASVFEKHANIIIKAPHGTSQDIFDLSQKMQYLIKDKFGIDIIREVSFGGEFKGGPEKSLTKEFF